MASLRSSLIVIGIGISVNFLNWVKRNRMDVTRPQYNIVAIYTHPKESGFTSLLFQHTCSCCWTVFLSILLSAVDEQNAQTQEVFALGVEEEEEEQDKLSLQSSYSGNACNSTRSHPVRRGQSLNPESPNLGRVHLIPNVRKQDRTREGLPF